MLFRSGAGKSTFLDLLAGRIEPTAGRVDRGTTVKVGYYDQLGATLDDAQRVRDAVAGPTKAAPTLEDAKLDTNVCAYIGTGLWHHWLCTWDRGFVDHLWPTVRRALDWVLSMRRPDGLALWARTADETPWGYALLTGTSSIAHALRCGVQLAELAGEPRPDWVAAADTMADAVANRPDAFEPKQR